MTSLFVLYPRPGSNRHAFKGQGILSPSCLPIPPLRHYLQKIPISLGTLWSGKRDSNSRPRPWQGRALPTELFPQKRSGKRDSNSRPRPWQGRALPTELFPLCLQIGNLVTFAQGFRLRIARQKYNFFRYRKQF